MSTTHTERSERTNHSGPRSLAPPPASVPLHPRSFKLRFASQREPGRSRVSALKPLALPATVTDKFHRREKELLTEEPLQRVQDMFGRGPRDKFPAPLTTSHEYGWWAERASCVRSGSVAARLHHHIRDSAWLKERVRVLATDAGFKRL